MGKPPSTLRPVQSPKVGRLQHLNGTPNQALYLTWPACALSEMWRGIGDVLRFTRIPREI